MKEPSRAGIGSAKRSPPDGFVEPSAALEARIFAAVAGQPSPTRSAVVRETIALTLLSWCLALAVFVYAGGPRITGRPWGLVLGTTTGTAIATAALVWAALGPRRSSLPRARRLLVPAVIFAPIAILAWKLLWSSQYPSALEIWPSRPGFRCLGLGLSMGLFPLIAFAISRRGSDPRRPALTGLAAGAAIGCVAALFTDLWCPVAYLPHLLLGHVLPIAILAGLGAWLGRRVITLRNSD